ncbi:M24 family metallopeptidase [Weissella confusa]|uniref:M24 family metallopeptidase n=1 Tax=Weissella confusa TaxID=1583 RepID=A0A923NIB9_WEICO|nr:M24 family metallopeptidase [Weissella confusa]
MTGQDGNRLGDIGAAINAFVEDENGYGNVRDYVGHGIQPTMHEDPNVFHYGVAGRGLRLKPGMTITIEPMEVAHAFPRKALFLKEGDIVTVDTVVELDGYYSDSAWTYAVGEVSPEAQRLMDVAKEAMYIGIEQAQVEIEGMRKSGAIIAGMHQGLRDIIKPGISTWEIEEFSRQYIESHGGRAAQIGFEGYEYATTVSVNEAMSMNDTKMLLDRAYVDLFLTSQLATVIY